MKAGGPGGHGRAELSHNAMTEAMLEGRFQSWEKRQAGHRFFPMPKKVERKTAKKSKEESEGKAVALDCTIRRRASGNYADRHPTQRNRDVHQKQMRGAEGEQ